MRQDPNGIQYVAEYWTRWAFEVAISRLLLVRRGAVARGSLGWPAYSLMGSTLRDRAVKFLDRLRLHK